MNADTLEEMSSELNQARRLLLHPSPANLERCEALLAGLLRQLQSWPDVIQAIPPQQRAAMGSALMRVQSELARLQRLLDSAAEWFAGWSTLRGLLESGYDCRGGPAQALPETRAIAEV